MIVFVAGMPRAGSMWTFNVVRALYTQQGTRLLPTELPVDETAAIGEALRSPVVAEEVYCIKTHKALKHPLPTRHPIKFICNIRDVRDACLSYMRFMHADFDTGLNTMMGMMRITDHYLQAFGDQVLMVRFEDIGEAPLATIDRICAFLDLEVPEAERRRIEEQYSKKAIRHQLDQLSNIAVDPEGRLADTEDQGRYAVIDNLDGTRRVLDKTTLFQSNHITSSRDGEWREAFDPGQIAEIHKHARDWLERYGYPS